MKKIKRVLCPTDFSKASYEALEEAIAYCRTFGAALDLLHVIELDAFVTLYGGDSKPYRNVEAQVKKISRNELNKQLEKVDARGVKVRASCVLGMAADAVCEYANREKSDLIIMSTHGRSGFKRMFLGSVAEKVVRMAPCSVLTYKSRSR